MLGIGVIAAVAAIFAVERIGVIALTRSAAGRDWIREHRAFHPNTLSMVRCPMGLVSIGMWIGIGPPPAIIWFAMWMISDLTDGTIARGCNLASERGKWLDPLSDKCMVLPALLFFALWPGIRAAPPVGVVAVLVVVDVFGQASRRFSRRSAANLFGKAKTGLCSALVGIVGFHQLGGVPGASSESVAWLSALAAVLAVLSVAGKLVSDDGCRRVLLAVMGAVVVGAGVSWIRAGWEWAALAAAAAVMVRLLGPPVSRVGAVEGAGEREDGGNSKPLDWFSAPNTVRVVLVCVGLLSVCYAVAVPAAAGGIGGTVLALAVAIMALAGVRASSIR